MHFFSLIFFVILFITVKNHPPAGSQAPAWEPSREAPASRVIGASGKDLKQELHRQGRLYNVDSLISTGYCRYGGMRIRCPGMCRQCSEDRKHLPPGISHERFQRVLCAIPQECAEGRSQNREYLPHRIPYRWNQWILLSVRQHPAKRVNPQTGEYLSFRLSYGWHQRVLQAELAIQSMRYPIRASSKTADQPKKGL
jgi:hypothetical protein